MGEKTGVGVYAQNLVRGLAEIDSNNQYLLYFFFWHCFPQEKVKKSSYPRKKNFKLFAPSQLKRTFLKFLWYNTALSKEKLLRSPDIIHSTAYTSPFLERAKLIVTFHDMTFFTHPQHHFEANRIFCTEQVHLGRRYAARIITVSEHSKKDIIRYLHLPAEKVKVIYEAVDKRFKEIKDNSYLFSRLKKYNLTFPYILYHGSVEPRKNLKRVIQAFHQFSSKHSSYHLVISGAKGWLNEEIYQLIDRLKMREKIKVLGYVPEEDVPFLYNGAFLFLFPSLYEGFGLPVLEAMACGVPVVTSNVSSLPEVAGEAAILVNPEKVEEIVEAMKGIVENKNLRFELKEKSIKQSQKFTLEKMAAETLAVYEEVYHEQKNESGGFVL
jgi:glycosyltransferase involved in cell wall biosynthesis